MLSSTGWRRLKNICVASEVVATDDAGAVIALDIPEIHQHTSERIKGLLSITFKSDVDIAESGFRIHSYSHRSFDSIRSGVCIAHTPDLLIEIDGYSGGWFAH